MKSGQSLRQILLPYELFYYLSDIEHTKTKARHPQTNGLCERMNQIILDEFWRTAFRKNIYKILDEIQVNLDAYMVRYNELRTNQVRHCDGRPPMQTFLEGKPLCERYVPKNDGGGEINFEGKIENVDLSGNQLLN